MYEATAISTYGQAGHFALSRIWSHVLSFVTTSEVLLDKNFSQPSSSLAPKKNDTSRSRAAMPNWQTLNCEEGQIPVPAYQVRIQYREWIRLPYYWHWSKEFACKMVNQLCWCAVANTKFVLLLSIGQNILADFNEIWCWQVYIKLSRILLHFWQSKIINRLIERRCFRHLFKLTFRWVTYKKYATSLSTATSVERTKLVSLAIKLRLCRQQTE